MGLAGASPNCRLSSFLLLLPSPTPPPLPLPRSACRRAWQAELAADRFDRLLDGPVGRSALARGVKLTQRRRRRREGGQPRPGLVDRYSKRATSSVSVGNTIRSSRRSNKRSVAAASRRSASARARSFRSRSSRGSKSAFSRRFPAAAISRYRRARARRAAPIARPLFAAARGRFCAGAAGLPDPHPPPSRAAQPSTAAPRRARPDPAMTAS